jgi:hypothetical protein
LEILAAISHVTLSPSSLKSRDDSPLLSGAFQTCTDHQISSRCFPHCTSSGIFGLVPAKYHDPSIVCGHSDVAVPSLPRGKRRSSSPSTLSRRPRGPF